MRPVVLIAVVAVVVIAFVVLLQAGVLGNVATP